MIPKQFTSNQLELKYSEGRSGFELGELARLPLPEEQRSQLREFFCRVSSSREYRELANKSYFVTCFVCFVLAVCFGAVFLWLMLDEKLHETTDSAGNNTIQGTKFCFCVSLAVCIVTLLFMVVKSIKNRKRFALVCEQEALLLKEVKQAVLVSVIVDHRRRHVLGTTCFPTYKFVYHVRTDDSLLPEERPNDADRQPLQGKEE